MNKADNSTVIPWKSLSEGQKIKASSDVKSDIWWVRLQNGKYGLTINFNGIVHIDLAQIRFSGADANLADVNGKSVFALSLREDADIDKIVDKLAKKLEDTANNVGGGDFEYIY